MQENWDPTANISIYFFRKKYKEETWYKLPLDASHDAHHKQIP